WERFSYYGMRSLLVLYMVNYLFVHPDVGQRVLGFTAVKAFIENLPWVKSLGPLAAQPLSSQIYGLYTGFVYFTPFLGGMLADRVLGQKVGWHYGFAAAGVGMVIGLCLYLWGNKHLAPDVLSQRKAAQKTAVKEKMSANEWQRVLVLIIVCTLNIVFWGVYEQQGNVMQLWADKNTNWHFFGWEMPSTWYQAFNPLMIFAFAPLLSMVWVKQAKGGKEPSSVTKMGFGCLLLGISYIVMIVASRGMAPEVRRSVLWLVGTTVIITLGELYLSPVGLSFVTKIAPARMVSMLMGVW